LLFYYAETKRVESQRLREPVAVYNELSNVKGGRAIQVVLP